MPSDSPLIDAEEQRVRAPRAVEEPRKQWLTARDGVTLRPEAVGDDGRALPWRDVRSAFAEYIWREWHAAETWDAEKGVRPTSHRFGHQYACDHRGAVLGIDRAVTELFDTVTTAHVVRRATAFGSEGHPQPPADHLRDLLDGNGRAFDAYRRHLREEGYRYVRVTVLEPHRNGYLHAHDGLWIEGDVTEARIRPAIDAHLRAVPQATVEAHGSEAVSVEQVPDRQHLDADHRGCPPTTALPRELTKQLGGFAPFRDPDTGNIPDRDPSVPPVLQASRGRQRGYALLWARGLRQYRPDRRLYPRCVKASQEMFGPVDDIDEATVPDPDDDVGEYDGGGVGMVDADGRAVEFDRIDGGEPQC